MTKFNLMDRLGRARLLCFFVLSGRFNCPLRVSGRTPWRYNEVMAQSPQGLKINR